MKLKRLISVILAVIIISGCFVINCFAAKTGIINGSDGSLNVRDLPGGSASTVIAVLKNGTEVNIISESGNWYYISFVGNNGSTQYGYVFSQYVRLSDSSSATVTEDVPALYSSYIKALKSAHPNWRFKFYQTGIDWKDVVANQTKAGKNAIASVPLSYKSTTSNFNITGAQYIDGYVHSDYVKRDGSSFIVSASSSSLTLREGASVSTKALASIPDGMPLYVMGSVTDADGKLWYSVRYYSSYGTYYYKTVEGSSWFQPHGQVVRYYLDPRNFLNEKEVFQFEQLAFDSSVHTESGVIAIIRDTFMNNTLIETTDGRHITYAKAIMEAAAKYNVSPYHLASRIIQEVGKNGSVASRGNSSSYPGIFNFYNIGAYTGVTDGLKWASQGTSYGRPWNSQYKSIIGGAQYIAESFIGIGQSTLYFQKFDVVSNGTKFYDHQYMSNIVAPSAEGVNVYKAYQNMGISDSGFVFMIPVYENMPSYAYPLPAKYNYPNMMPDSEEGYLQQFTDVSPDDWYYDAVKFVSDNGYILGYGNGKFGVNDYIQRQDFAVIMSRIAGAKLSNYSKVASDYPDVKSDGYYSSAVAWSDANGIISGYKDGRFGVGDYITKEQICTIIFRYARSIFKDTELVSTTDEILKKYADADEISDFAVETVAWCIEKGIMQADSNNMLNSAKPATRAEIAVMIQKMVEAGYYYKGYSDVSLNDWFYDAVQLTAHKGYISGYSNGKFGPSDDVQRQDFTVIMARVAGVDIKEFKNYSVSFPDVKGNAYYADAIRWSVHDKIMLGYSNGRFGVGDSLTRQDACTVIYRFAAYLGLDTGISEDEINAVLSRYGDKNQISEYARKTVAWCVKNKVISGKNGNTMAPLVTIKRAEIAQIITNMINASII